MKGTFKLKELNRKLKKDVKAIIYENVGHGFYNFSHDSTYFQLINDSFNILKELINSN